MQKQSSITDIAKKLNISVTTVSFILNGKAEEMRISKTLTNKVLKYVSEVGYVANHLAKSLRMGKTHILGLLVEDISNPFFARVAGAMEDIANKQGYRIFYCSSKNDTVKTKELLKVFEERQVDGYIITPVEDIQDNIRSLLANNNKVILFDRYFPEIDTSYVVVDNEKGAYDATKHLIDRGYKNIAFITTYSSQTQMAGRLQGYERALMEKKLKPYIKRVDFGENNEAIIGEICSFFSTNTHLDAVFFATNYLGVEGLEAIKRLHLRIPTQLAVVSFDDHDLFRLHSPSITAVAQPIQKMSETLITILLDSIEKGDQIHNQQVVVSPELIIRESSTAKV